MIDELKGLGVAGRCVRIPPEMDVPLTDRVARLLDTAALRRLSRISQLGLVQMVYPGAVHSRLEHSLGVYRNALLVLRNLTLGSGPGGSLTSRAAEAFLLAALLHDAGHWPFCHAIEDMQLPGLRRHELRVAELVGGGEIAAALAADWAADGDDVMSLLTGQRVGRSEMAAESIELLASCLSGPIDVDKLDYLVRDSLHAGVPYGRHFDSARLVGAMTVDPRQPRLAITDKGRTAAEMMVFARYVMFSEVYWHHAVRSATAMLQRSVLLLRQHVDLEAMLQLDDAGWIAAWRQAADRYECDQALTSATDRPQSGSGGCVATSGVGGLVEGLFGPVRSLYKRAGEFSVSQRGALHRSLARRPYWWLVACGDSLARGLAVETGLEIGPCDVLIDAPPVKLEVDINVAVVAREGPVRQLADVSPVADALARQQFDDHVKRVRIFVRPDLRPAIAPLLADDSRIRAAIEATENEIV